MQRKSRPVVNQESLLSLELPGFSPEDLERFENDKIARYVSDATWPTYFKLLFRSNWCTLSVNWQFEKYNLKWPSCLNVHTQLLTVCLIVVLGFQPLINLLFFFAGLDVRPFLGNNGKVEKEHAPTTTIGGLDSEHPVINVATVVSQTFVESPNLNDAGRSLGPAVTPETVDRSLGRSQLNVGRLRRWMVSCTPGTTLQCRPTRTFRSDPAATRPDHWDTPQNQVRALTNPFLTLEIGRDRHNTFKHVPPSMPSPFSFSSNLHRLLCAKTYYVVPMTILSLLPALPKSRTETWCSGCALLGYLFVFFGPPALLIELLKLTWFCRSFFGLCLENSYCYLVGWSQYVSSCRQFFYDFCGKCHALDAVRHSFAVFPRIFFIFTQVVIIFICI